MSQKWLNNRTNKNNCTFKNNYRLLGLLNGVVSSYMQQNVKGAHMVDITDQVLQLLILQTLLFLD